MASVIELADNAGAMRSGVEGGLNRRLNQGPFFFHHDDLIKSSGKLAYRLRFQRIRHPDLQNSQ